MTNEPRFVLQYSFTRIRTLYICANYSLNSSGLFRCSHTSGKGACEQDDRCYDAHMSNFRSPLQYLHRFHTQFCCQDAVASHSIPCLCYSATDGDTDHMPHYLLFFLIIRDFLFVC
ncbi:unnamed protein product [Rhizophagus irregularis]|uniref:Uncharacterized protein n=1 Tax=Rhizophagus irregularis TaxID=588596 RepID=A0A916E8A8_9GLOM|nr:unnamed protein product [Rhizophagus irregularis]